jgi:hypothetical protein
MRHTIATTTVATALLAGAAALAISAGAQNASPTLPPVPPAAGTTAAPDPQELADMKDLAEQGARLKADTEGALKEFEARQKDLDAINGNVKGARQLVDNMIALLRQAQERLGPDSPYMKALQAHEAAVRALAAQALASPNPADRPYGAQLSEQAAVIGSMQTEARGIASRFASEIDRIDRSRSQITYATAVHQTDEFIKLARGYLDTAKGLLASTSNLADKAGQLARPTVPTQ